MPLLRPGVKCLLYSCCHEYVIEFINWIAGMTRDWWHRLMAAVIVRGF